VAANLSSTGLARVCYLRTRTTTNALITGSEALHSQLVKQADWSATEEAASFVKNARSKEHEDTQRLYRSLGRAAHLGWARLLVDRYRDLVEVPAPTREDPGGGRHHFAPDDEDASKYENYHNPDHPY
jgi:hypothetical protein